MKVLIAAFVVIALAQGSLAQDAIDLETLSQKFEDIKNQMTAELSRLINTQDLSTQAQAFLEEQKKQFEPMLASVQQQLRTAAASMHEQIEPMTTNLQSQLEPVMQKFQEQMEAILKQVTQQAKALTN
ncbi:type-4 ice-structuring protein LS-12-like [Phyllopteryx taeniolatus]|uniref:type-4 ice-structuring protein LS-12-like n=1 Tax=Phyllopteryx taeniolatus TaxID=161469 RepID=UPI002AD2FEA8|nr:type-4 ice-structuring protein LS-12-like [Phyllopteryx taeniolatus]